MGFKDWVSKKQAERAEKKRLEILEEERIRDEERKSKQAWQEKLKQFHDILDHFEIPELKSFCKNFLGSESTEKRYFNEETKKSYVVKPDRLSHIEFIKDYFVHGQLKLQQLKDYSLKHRILTPSYFGMESQEAGDQREFENIMNAVRAEFQPENITNEEHLEAQLTIFLKAKFREKKVERQITTKSGDQIDILIDGKYVLELKVPKKRTDLRNLLAQLDEYKEEYPYLCAIIADISGTEDDVVVVEPRLAQNIKDYVDRYKVKLSVPSLVLNVKKRG